MADSGKSSSNSADAYLGSIISLISKSEIRYEGVLGGIDTEKCTIELHRVKSFGTEGRTKDGPQIAASDIEYAYVVFKGSDLKDLQCKSSPQVHAEQQMHEDPAIIKSHYAQAPSMSAQAASIGGRSLTGVSSHPEPSAIPRPVYPGALPSYQPGEPMGGRGSWGSATQNVDGVSLAMPMYSSEYYGSSSTLPHVQQQPVPFQFPSTMPGPSILQNQLHYPEVQVSSSLPSDISSSLSIKSSLPFNLTPVPADSLTMASLPLSNQHLNPITTSFSHKSGSATISGVPIQSSSSSILGSTSGPSLTVSPALSTSDQLTQAEPLGPSSTQTSSLEENNLVPTSSKLSAAVSSAPNQVPLLPLPHSSQQRQIFGPPFAEEFDFEAMNEKFKKEEVWGYLGKAKERNNAEGTEGNEIYQREHEDSGYRKGPEFDVKPVYVKDEFFDTLTSDSLSRRARNGGIKFSERMKLDTETFGSFQQRSQMGRGGHGFGRGGYNRGSYNQGRGNGYGVRGHGVYRP
ncbi:FDF domain [Macleaya cordata]|uniref:FDF domain n=1 Tax=Macleaya cordata TaxID=56857 RepID=A0A200R6M8_MACCD|nr:FDF domain [Macleaya cordata]